MTYKIVGDSSCDVTKEMMKAYGIAIAPLSFTLDGIEYIDDDQLDLENYLKKIDESPNTPKSACPSISDYMSLFEGGHECTFVVTLSTELSGSYNSAMNAREMFLEENPTKKVHVIDSRGAASGEVLMALKLVELAESGLGFEEVVEKIEKYRDENKVIFVLDKIDTLEKNGRLSVMKAKIVRALNLKLILMATNEGAIDLRDKARGTKKALKKMVEIMGKEKEITDDLTIVIAHTQAKERAEDVKALIEATYSHYKEIIIVPTKGLSSTYANVGGIIVSY